MTLHVMPCGATVLQLLYHAVASSGTWPRLAHGLIWHMVSSGTWPHLAHGLVWHMASSGTCPPLTHGLVWLSAHLALAYGLQTASL